MARITNFADVILPLAVPNTFTYRVPHELGGDIAVGQRVIVQFGKNRLYSGIVYRIHQTPPKVYEAKYLEAILDETPVVTEKQLKLWDWMAEYYCCYLGEIMVASLPASLKLASETKILLRENAGEFYQHLSNKEAVIYDALKLRDILTLQEIAEILSQKTVYSIVKSMLEKGVVVVEEELKEKYRPKTEEYVQLTAQARDEAHLKSILDALIKAPRQLDLVMRYLQLIDGRPAEGAWIRKTDLQKMAGVTATVTNQLVEKGVFELTHFETDRLRAHGKKTGAKKELSEKQQEAYEKITALFEEKSTVLLHGVTSSGKTEIYMKLIETAIKNGEQVLYLLPEIALTTQLIIRLQQRFGETVGIYHSRFNPQERAELWHKLIKKEKYQVIVGARSAVFLPFTNLSLIIVDEEHETSFKQQDPAPRYHARDTALVLGATFGARVLLGSATPSVETYHNAVLGKYGLAQLFARYNDVQMPEIVVADTSKKAAIAAANGHFSPLLLQEIQTAFDNNEQVILFQNRRGFSPRWQCDTCGWTPMCVQCDISMTYHKFQHKLHCHYCGHKETPPKKCTACGSHALKMIGFGTEKIEEDLAGLFPEKRIARMDYDTTRSRNAYGQIIADFENRNVDVLIGTQMVTKGLDFDSVGLVGIMDASQMLYHPDFRAYERAYQLMAQVSGRAGRRHKRGKVVIQSNQPEHWVISQVIANNYDNLYTHEISERENFRYPPFYRLIQLTLKHIDKALTDTAADMLATNLRQFFGEMILGPEYPGVERVRNQYQKNIMLKFPRTMDHLKIKHKLRLVIDDFQSITSYRAVRVNIDVDPY